MTDLMIQWMFTQNAPAWLGWAYLAGAAATFAWLSWAGEILGCRR